MEDAVDSRDMKRPRTDAKPKPLSELAATSSSPPTPYPKRLDPALESEISTLMNRKIRNIRAEIDDLLAQIRPIVRKTLVDNV